MTKYIVAALLFAFAGSAYAAEGAAVYKSKCQMCHGPEGKGAKMAPEPIAGKDATTVKKAVVEGHGKMKPVKGVSPEDAQAVSEYVAGLKK